MKRKISLLAALFIQTISFAQYATSLSENMNTTCPASSHSPSDWAVYNPPSTPDTRGMWNCDATGGRFSTTGVSCSGLFGTPLTYHLDTSILISPPLKLNGYTKIYVNFDTKTTNFNLGAKIEFLASGDSTMGADTATSDTFTVYNRTTSTMPLFSSGDETDWVTHQVDLSDLKNIVPLYLGFRYTSANGTSGSRWYLDNINTTTILLPSSVNDPALSQNGIIAAGNISNGSLSLFCSTSIPGTYSCTITDMTGRSVYKELVHLNSGNNTRTVTGLSLPQGIYLLTISNAQSHTTTRIQAW